MQPDFMEFVGGWKEQRDYGINVPLTHLSDDHILKQNIQFELDQLDNIADIDAILGDYAEVDATAIYTIGGLNVAFATDGSLSTLQNGAGRNWASSLGKLQYQTCVYCERP